MKKIITLFVTLLSFSYVSTAQFITIAEARAKPAGTVVTVRGRVINSSELGTTIRYFQDGTGALCAYYSSATVPTFSTTNRGDSIEVTGTLKDYQNLLELDPITSFSLIGTTNVLVPPLSITPAGMAEVNESKLVKLFNGQFTGAGTPTFVGNTNYKFNVDGTEVLVRIATGSALVGKTIPSVSVNLIGICSQFATNYQLLPRDSADIDYQSIAITTPVKVDALAATGFSLNWQTNLEGSSEIQFGTTPSLGTTVMGTPNTKSHTATVSNQTASKVLYVRVFSRANGKTDSSLIFPVITASLSTGETRVYFNHAVDTTVKVGLNNKALATTGSRCESEIVSYITNAKSSIDVAMYNNSSTAIVGALKLAAAKGVRVRYIADKNSTNSVLADTTGFGFKVIKKPTTDLMHNKFMIIDADSVNTSWVMSGAMNWSLGQIYTDYNNAIFIQDKSLAMVYRMEFEEMWGSSTATPNTTLGKFGADKKDNTPKQVKLAGKLCEIYFSPTDETSLAIINAVNTADVDLELSLLIFTYFDLGTAVNNAQRRGASVRGLVDQDTMSASSQINYLQRNNVNIKLFKAGGTVIYHHKYALIDAKPAGINSDPMVVTGSHNWTNTAERANDENTLIIHDAAVANIYLQDFEARWKEQSVGTKEVPLEGFEATLYPNPTSDVLNISLKNDLVRDVTVTILNTNGQPLESIIYRNQSGELTKTIPLSNMASGTYFVSFMVDGKFLTKTIQIMR